jgi:hypothetical protein
MNTQPTPEDEQIMNDILIQLERMKQNQKIYTCNYRIFWKMKL